ncbi:hypothetical protein [Hydrocarboniphaga sp.]|uniref:hypothetical protein n=1 Tax=Hydrocarboniphaga sp. TaxID=2033016 RepID=UPI002624DF81|nr:hypothetical protein [Hydrocarboniphaga sp.]
MNISLEQLAPPEFLSAERTAVKGFKHKYMKFEIPFQRKAAEVGLLSLDTSEPLNVLDLGAGGGHFCRILNELGHSATALTQAQPPMFVKLCDLLGVDVIAAKLGAKSPIPITKRYQLVTASRITFNRTANRVWSKAEWTAFLDHLEQDILVPGGGLFLSFNIIGKQIDEAEEPSATAHREIDVIMKERGLRALTFGIYVSKNWPIDLSYLPRVDR